MKRVILDTNIYGRMVEKREEERIRELIGKRPDIIIYGFDVVRKELRAASQQMRIDGKRLRLILLGIYDHLTERHMFDTTKLTKKLAEDYYAIYSRIGGIVSKNEIINDFLIVACASIHQLRDFREVVNLTNSFIALRNFGSFCASLTLAQNLSSFIGSISASKYLKFSQLLLVAILFSIPVLATHNPSVSHPANAVTNGMSCGNYSYSEVGI